MGVPHEAAGESGALESGGSHAAIGEVARQRGLRMINFCALQSAWRGAPRLFLRLEDILKWTGKNARPSQRLFSGRRPDEDARIAGKESEAT